MQGNDNRLRFAIFGNEYQPRKSAAMQRILEYLYAHDAEIYVDRTFFDFITSAHLC